MSSIQIVNEDQTPVEPIHVAPGPQNGALLPQPRQPANLQGLLRYAMETTTVIEDPNSGSGAVQLDEERKKFLETALSSMTTNIAKVLQDQIEVLKTGNVLDATDRALKFEEAVEILLDYIDNIDVANDFHKMGGFQVLKPCLKSKNELVRAGACSLIGELCQNNPQCQKASLDNEFIPILIEMLDTEESDDVGLKCLSALSAICRNNEEAFAQLTTYGGFHVFIKTLQKDEDKFKTKTAFLLNSLCTSQPSLKCRLMYFGVIPILIEHISKGRTHSTEHCLRLLLAVVEDNATALNECKKPEYNFKEGLEKYRLTVADKEDAQEELEDCQRLQHLLFE